MEEYFERPLYLKGKSFPPSKTLIFLQKCWQLPRVYIQILSWQMNEFQKIDS